MSDRPRDLAARRQLTRRIIAAYDPGLVRAYCRARFTIINSTILDMLGLALRGRHRILEIGCGFGLFGSYFASLDPEVRYHGLDLNARRIEMANTAAARLGLSSVRFEVADARQPLVLDDAYDAVLMMDLLHHVPDDTKRELLATVARHVAPGGSLVIKDIVPRPWPKLAFTWALDVLMTRGFEMWYWDERRFAEALPAGWTLESYPISDWLPYPHVLMLGTRDAPAPRVRSAGA